MIFFIRINTSGKDKFWITLSVKNISCIMLKIDYLLFIGADFLLDSDLDERAVTV